MNTKTILIVDDEMKIRILLKDFLEKEGYHVLEAADGKQAIEIYEASMSSIDLVLLDVMLPIFDGWTVCREIKKKNDVPIIMLTARSEDFDEVHGFEIGADDYVKKPVKPSALVARINSLFKRIDKLDSNKHVFYLDQLEIDPSSHLVTLDGEVINLSPKEFELLLMLTQNLGQVISREQLLNQVWGYEYYGGERTVDTHINRLRIKLGSKGNAIATIRGYGYRFEV
ncbi:MAG: DNA-binding response regulator [Firmicutes bacterium HGW-Firmicutes-1]|jgi:DNA-binding response OmpR family regulator|nr:MAG: DNA-binding response regulator [Firmicutes bacterium HGW-Firmicutes-1]